MSKTWCFYYYGWFGRGDSSDDIDYETEVSDAEFDFLETIDKYQKSDEEDFDIDQYLEENQKLIDELMERVQEEVEEFDYDNYEEDDDKPEIIVRWPWE